MARRRLMVLCWLLIAVAGCGAQMEPHRSPATPLGSRSNSVGTGGETADAVGSSTQQPPADKSVAAKDVSKRRIVYRATVDLVVEQFDPLPEQMEAAVKQHDGFIAASEVTGTPGSPRSARWTIRVPVDAYPRLLAAVRQLGEVRSSSLTSDDVTAEYCDVEARLRNKRQEEERLLKLLSEATGKLEEILAVERELSRVRGEIEQTQGRMRVLRDLTELTTVTVSVTEIRGYVPEQSPSYVTRVRRVFAGSSTALISTVQDGSLLAVALVPWLPVPLVLVVLVVMIRRFRRRRP